MSAEYNPMTDGTISLAAMHVYARAIGLSNRSELTAAERKDVDRAIALLMQVSNSTRARVPQLYESSPDDSPSCAAPSTDTASKARAVMEGK